MSGGSDETPVSKISYIDVPVERQKSHQYAIPQVNNPKEDTQPIHHHHHHSQQSSLSHNSDTGYYSSTPVPVEYRSNTLPHAQINSSFTTFTSKKQKQKHDPRLIRSSTNITQYPKDNSVGYFSNGRYYDPSPRPEIYAPASSYSDRENKVMSTFLSDLPQDAQSISSSVSSLYVEYVFL